jgi:hypothetical protein
MRLPLNFRNLLTWICVKGVSELVQNTETLPACFSFSLLVVKYTQNKENNNASCHTSEGT